MIRQRLENRRPSERIPFEHNGKRGEIRVGFPVEVRADGIAIAEQPGELFIIYGMVGSDVEAAARDAGLILSIAMQHGIDLRTFAISITRGDDGRPASVTGAAIEKIVQTYWPVSGGE